MTRSQLRNRIKINKMIRYGLLLVFLIVVIVSLSGKGVSRKSFESVSAAVSSSIRTDKCIKDSERYLKKYFGLNADDYDGVLIYIPATNMYANEVLLIKLKDTSQADTVSAAIEKRIDSQINIFEGYAPLEVALLKNAILDVRGNYILYVVEDDAAAIDEAFRGSL